MFKSKSPSSPTAHKMPKLPTLESEIKVSQFGKETWNPKKSPNSPIETEIDTSVSVLELFQKPVETEEPKSSPILKRIDSKYLELKKKNESMGRIMDILKDL
jgi:hypothetical protein